MLDLLRPLARFVAAHPQGVTVVAFFAVMGLLKLAFSGIIIGFGHIGFIAIMLSLAAIALILA